MNIRNLQKNWNEFGKKDPLWAILTHPNKIGGKWEINEFFNTGVREIDEIMKYIDSLNIEIFHHKTLDFGCGVGRLTQPLVNYFEYVDGIDIAPSMIKFANIYNKYKDRCHYYLNDVNNLKLFEDNRFDFIYSKIVLQHMEPEYSKNYIKEFLRILVPGGLIVFQMPSDPNEHNISNKHEFFNADITPVNALSEMEPGSKKVLFVKIKNIGNDVWNVSDRIRLGNHWLDQKKNIIVLDDGRTDLNKDLIVGEEAELSLDVTAPNVSGDYLLELDIVKEGVTWFKDRGSMTSISDVKIFYSNPIKKIIYLKIVDPTIKLLNKINKTFFPRNMPIMEIYAIKKSDIIELIEENGGRIINVKEDYSVGKEWISYLYFITKDKYEKTIN